MDIVDFEWDEWNQEKVYAHGVTPDEVEQCFFNQSQWHKKKSSRETEQDRYYLLGWTDGGRSLFYEKD